MGVAPQLEDVAKQLRLLAAKQLLLLLHLLPQVTVFLLVGRLAPPPLYPGNTEALRNLVALLLQVSHHRLLISLKMKMKLLLGQLMALLPQLEDACAVLLPLALFADLLSPRQHLPGKKW